MPGHPHISSYAERRNWQLGQLLIEAFRQISQRKKVHALLEALNDLSHMVRRQNVTEKLWLSRKLEVAVDILPSFFQYL